MTTDQPQDAPSAIPITSARQEVPRARVEPVSRRWSLAWALPVIALGIGAVLAWQALMERGHVITIRFDNAQGLKADDAIVHRGLRVGTVRDVRLTGDLQAVEVEAEIRRDAGGIAVEGSRFWIVRPEVSLRGVSGLETLLGSRYVEVEPGPPDSPRRREFAGEAERPRPGVGDEDPGPAPDDTLEIVVRAKRRGSLGVGSPVTYRDVHVGEVRSYRLAGDARCVEIVIGIAGRYRPLVRDNSVFWNVSGIGVEWGVFSGLTVQSDSIESILTGGIAFATPEKRTGAEVEPGHVFDLADKPDEAWLNWAPAIEIGPAAR